MASDRDWLPWTNWNLLKLFAIYFLFLWSYFSSFVMEMRNANQLEYTDVSWATRVMEFIVRKLSFM